MIMNAEVLSGFDKIFLDLDDTLIYERDYLFSVYHKISIEFGKNSIESLNIYEYLRNNFEQGNRSKLFNNLINEFEIPLSNLNIMLDILRGIKLNEGLNLTPEAKVILLEFRKINKQYGIITNGNPEQQANKIKQVKWEGYLEPANVIFANEYEPKPSPLSIDLISKPSKRKKLLYIGDSDVDRDFALNAGVSFYRLVIKNKCSLCFVE
jgi:phosphoglycolate phosphatase-like HAD superfamily hydrolase